ncbi:MerR family transcriptional regulator [Paratractidigestivibacter sp.]|uniref:MerR family transcriptional regulator n=1 Tax=Paratractidigestivibacter sp. TaxID=2847316 RepID=UPI002AC9ADCD|nr:MerR family transcriptional regulator [Paratractidigestivibacter sp.]
MRCTQKEMREKLGISRDTLRFYEQKGIIEPEVDPQNGYRYYDDWQVNLLWDCKQYQAMGFSLAEVLEILKSDTMDDLCARVERRSEEVVDEIRRKELELTCLRTRAAEMRRAERSLGLFELIDFTGRVYVPIREDHGFREGVGAEAVAFSNAHFSVSEPLLWFPEAGRDHFFWGYACTPATYRALGAPEAEWIVRIEAATALSTWVDAGERWNVGLSLFEGLLDEARSRGLEPRHEICADLVARAHGADGYHRYLHAYLPLV